MPIPDFQKLMLLSSKCVSDGQSHSISLVHDSLSKEFNLTEDEVNQFLASGSQKIFYNRVYWAKAYLKMAGLIENTTRGHFKITNAGSEVLRKNLPDINIKYLRQFSSFQESMNKREEEKEVSMPNDTDQVRTPEEIISTNYLQIRKALSIELLAKVKQSTPAFLETLVVQCKSSA